ncbi:aminodeoxychorismate synthase component I [Thalassomonas sp. M1454]|uniref:aminodeoxychorismate synthase component I n=1 Tax=Thalassomonas sp. M1454 TaxID=2594477 RepID=UPI00117D1200|nr:aminodeoxychorismate synthase component I [Thalassomonas sp. M1454]TRX56414.1 aminodeoxychorismate synthase component I [Thalassomonas sp. M1454]
MNDTTSSLPYFTCELSVAKDLTPEQLFSAFSNDNWAFWLDSGNSSHVDCRFDIFVFEPIVTLKTAITSTRIYWPAQDKLELSNQDPLLLIKQLQSKIFPETINEHNDIPFCGGALGYFSYDLGRRFEKLPSTSVIDIGLPDMAVGIYRSAIIFDNKTKLFTLVSHDNNLSELIEKISTKLAANSAINSTFELTSEWRANMTKEQYREKFAKVQEYLLSGDCYQINLAQRFSAMYEGDEFAAYKKLRASNNAPFSAFMRIEEGVILSISPERFLQLKNQKVQSKPIKGTRPRSNIAEFDQEHAIELQNSAKDRAENLMIVDLLRNDISKVCRAGTVNVPSLFEIESFPAVHHLVSTVEGMLQSNFDGTDLIRGAFPGGSITGAPKIRAMEIIEELEPNRRSVYCGSIGYISACGKIDTSITIRTLVCEFDKIHCWAGGGLVADSKVDSEYQETFDKVNKILPILKL